MDQEQLFASFILDQQQELEIALKAEQVTEATPVQGKIKKLPGSIPFLEGVMHLREDVIPVVNLKKRLGLESAEYKDNAMVAVVSLFNNRFGLLFEDIKEVFRADQKMINPVNKVLQTNDQIISALINVKPGHQSVELLDLEYLFEGDFQESVLNGSSDNADQSEPVTYSRFIAFEAAGQEYGVPVNLSREITFCTEIDEMFQTGITAGALELRGTTIPILNTNALLTGDASAEYEIKEDTRILILTCDDCVIGLIVDEIKEILSIPDKQILPFTSGNNDNVLGVYPRTDDENTILLNIKNLICEEIEDIKSMSRFDEKKDEAQEIQDATSHHLITENCYLIFSIGKNFAIEIKDVHEIIENHNMMKVPKANGHARGVINLRGEVVPIVDLRTFYGYPTYQERNSTKLIICRGANNTIALEVDEIVNIYKQEKFHDTPSLGQQLSDKKDTLNRLIEYVNTSGIKEHVLVVNARSIIQNHMEWDNAESTNDYSQQTNNENTHITTN